MDYTKELSAFLAKQDSRGFNLVVEIDAMDWSWEDLEHWGFMSEDPGGDTASEGYTLRRARKGGGWFGVETTPDDYDIRRGAKCYAARLPAIYVAQKLRDPQASPADWYARAREVQARASIGGTVHDRWLVWRRDLVTSIRTLQGYADGEYCPELVRVSAWSAGVKLGDAAIGLLERLNTTHEQEVEMISEMIDDGDLVAEAVSEALDRVREINARVKLED